ncbi:hypothetical protein DNTS_021840 [Danionella cerebrum]|uniref:Perilipin n=1 Tax=Danionella cerebrum TaxID=2873325 RepID=A0A553QAI3_9TELE|nr:hypothetical protein DNTS_021840 [Danionella translucida]
MASESKDMGEVIQDKNVFLRILNLGSVSSALDSIEKTYSRTKQSYPIISSVCGLYEKGATAFGSLAVCSIRPALHVLEPQLVAANSLACRGLDQLEEKVPALQSPPEELASYIKELMSSTLLSAKDSIASPAKQTSNAVLDKVSVKWQQSKNVFNGGIQYILNSKLVSLVEQRANSALNMTETLLDYMFPASPVETGADGCLVEQDPNSEDSTPQHIFSRLVVLARTFVRRVFVKTSAQFHQPKQQGHKLLAQTPGITSLVQHTMSSMSSMAGMILGFPSSLAAFLKDGQQHSVVMEMNNGQHDQTKTNGMPNLVSGLRERLLKVYRAVVQTIKKSPETSFALAKNGISFVLGSFGKIREIVLSFYGLIPRRPSKLEEGSRPAENDGTEECLCGFLLSESSFGDFIHSPNNVNVKPCLNGTEPSEICEETRQLKNRLIKQIPLQQKLVLGGRNKKALSYRPPRKSGRSQPELQHLLLHSHSS